MKVALINNMNNNFFALTRFLRDKGVDAHLFQVDSLDPHFKPECDSYDITNISSYIHPIANIGFRDFFRLPLSLKMRYQLSKLKNALKNFDLVVACGGLAILERAGIKIDVFIPHGGDLYQSPFMFEYCIKKHFPYSTLMRQYIKYQRRAIEKSRAIIALASIDRHMHDALIRLNEKWLDWAIPMVYPLDTVQTGKWDYLQEHDFILFSHSRQGWKTAMDYKGNDRAIRAFARFIKVQSQFTNPIMVLFDYGPDVAASKELIKELNIQKFVHWMPTMHRKFIYEGLKKASLVFDYFHDEVVCFGGVTFEAFSCSAPVIGNSKLKAVDIKHTVPLVHAYTEDEILNVLLDYGNNIQRYKDYGKLSRNWFDENVGSGLVDKYIALFQYLSKNKSVTLKDPTFNLPLVSSFIGPDNIQ